MKQEQIVDGAIADILEVKNPGVKEKLNKSSKYFKRSAMASILGKDRKGFELIKTLEKKNEECNSLEYLDELVNAYRDYVEVADVEKEDFGEVMTPIKTVESMLNTLPKEVWSNPNLKWLDPCSGVGTFSSVVVQRLMKGLETFEPNPIKRYRHIIEEMIYVCELQEKNMFIFQCVFDKDDTNELNVYCGSFLDKKFDDYMSDVWGIEKFDIVMGNPPYQQGLHLKFFNKSFNILSENGDLVFIHPAQPFLNKKLSKKSKEEINTLKIVNEYKSTIELIDGNKIFNGASFFLPISITHIKNKLYDKINIIYRHFDMENPKYDVVETTDDIFPHGNIIVKDIKNKILSKMEKSVEESFYRKNNFGKLFVKLNKIGGNIPKGNKVNADFYCPIYKSFENDFEKHLLSKSISGVENIVGFNDINEAKNFFNYIKTKFVRFCLSITKVNQHLDRGEFCYVPFMDFTKKWNDFELYRYFNLNQEEINFINTFILDWYEQDKI
jgi:site-specific DNA-methyltransferase (adenine-specific)